MTGGLVSAAGTITGTSHLGAVVSVTANITGGNILTAGVVSATGNVTGNFFIGNGSQLTGIAAGTPTQIVSGTSNVSVVSSGGNVSVGIGGTGNVAVFATTGEYVTGLISASGNITGGNIITAGLISASGNVNVLANVNIGNANSVSWANASGVRAYITYNNSATSLDTVFI